MPRRRKPAPKPTISQWLGRRRRKWAWRTVAVVVALIIAVLVDRGGFLLAGRGDLGRYHDRTFLVNRVVDGDTFDIAAPDFQAARSATHHPAAQTLVPAVTRVRVWGIDTPETGQPADPARNRPAVPAEPFADQATDLATQLLAGQTVTLQLERTRPRGRFGRLLAHPRLPDGSLLAERLLLAGLARADPRWPHQHANASPCSNDRPAATASDSGHSPKTPTPPSTAHPPIHNPTRKAIPRPSGFSPRGLSWTVTHGRSPQDLRPSQLRLRKVCPWAFPSRSAGRAAPNPLTT